MAGWRQVAVAAAILLSACGKPGGGAPSPAEPSSWSHPPRAVQAALADLYGRITQVDADSRRILVEGVSNKAWLTVTEGTEIVALTDDGHVSAAFDALQTGRQVAVTFTGPVRESYPLQATAGQIIIIN